MAAKTCIERDSARAEYTKARNIANSALRKAKRSHERSIAFESKVNPKRFWYHTRRKLKSKSGIAPLLENMKDKDSLKFNDKEKAEILQKQFLSVFKREPDGEIPMLPRRTDSIIDDLQISANEVKTYLLKININKSIGPDEIHPRLLAELAEHLAEPVSLLVNKSFQYGVIPKDWKEAYITPIYKKGPKCHAENYRPISLTCILSKLVESLVRTKVLMHLQKNDLLSTRQYGFINGRSTTTQLLHFFDKCLESIVRGKVIDTIYFDFKKAFDMVPHKRLLGKLLSYGINGKILNWIQEFLLGRSQYVSVNGEKSSPGYVLSGIPQGTVLGPLLFVLYINDILDNVKCDGFLFADDTKIFKAITCKEEALHLQSDIDTMKKWSDVWGMEFNRDKCHVLTLGNFDNIRYTHRYKIDTVEIEHVSEEKDLGVLIDSGLTFEGHISRKAQVANGIVGLIRRSFSYLDPPSFKKIFCAFVRPHLEYGQAIWSPYLQKYIDVIERVQMRATKLVDTLGKMNYEDRLRKCGLTTLLFRRMRGDMIEIYKHFWIYEKSSLSPSFVQAADILTSYINVDQKMD